MPQRDQIGRLRHQIGIEKLAATPVRNSFGEVTTPFEPFCTCWARIRPATGRELEAMKQIGADATHMVEIRWRTGITPKMRLLHRGRYFDINHVADPEERRQWLILTCTETVTVGV